MTEKETPDAVSPENAANLLKLEEELKRSRDHWGVTYKILKRIREGELWRNGGVACRFFSRKPRKKAACTRVSSGSGSGPGVTMRNI